MFINVFLYVDIHIYAMFIYMHLFIYMYIISENVETSKLFFDKDHL